MNVQTPMPLAEPIDASVLTPPERLETLLELVLSFHALGGQRVASHVAFQNASALGRRDASVLGQLNSLAVERECACGEEILAHLKILAGDGTLDRCRDLLIQTASIQ